MPLLGCLAIKGQRLWLILGGTTPGGEQIGVVVLRPIQARLGSLLVFPSRRRLVDGTAPAMLQATPGHIACHQVTALCRDLEPAQGQRLVACNAAPFQQDLPEQGLGIDHALLGRHQDRLGCAHRGVVEHALQLLDGEYFFTAH